ncbi:hypothetical protein R9C00_00495 [Flammeovirgaceae bacterium SG7u.111]|nr:hypothetical protein [Flammeovirgaceae bacterium SG7u.132]WPO35928.1 hypothetical protein R9C00_00495 [Flammeovirgaceae bacterium SG7u.111]
MTIFDLILSPIFLIAIYLVAYKMRKKTTNRFTRKYFIPAFTVKLFGAVAFAFIYQFYYGGGDTFYYHKGAEIIGRAFSDNFFTGLKIMTLDAREYTGDTLLYTTRITYFKAHEEWTLVRIAAIAGAFCFQSYIGITFIFSFFAFSGTWKIYQTFIRFYPELYKPLAYAIFYIPSAIFWGSGLLKDSITLGALGWFTYAALHLVSTNKGRVRLIIIMLSTAWVILQLKAYILYAFLPPLMLWYYLKFKGGIKNPVLRYMSAPVLIILIAGAGALMVTSLAAQTEKYSSMEAIEDEISGFHGDHGSRAGGSSYSLGEIDYSIGGMLKKVPASVNVTLYRPYLWEARNPVMLIGALESGFYLMLTLVILFRRGIIRVFYLMVNNPEIQLCLWFTVIFGFAVGFVSYNFGALARFKIPLLPFFTAGLVLLYNVGKKKKKKKKRKKKIILKHQVN